MGIAWIGMALPNIPEVIEFFILIIDKPVNNEIVIFSYFILNIALIPLFMLLWLSAFLDLLNIGKKVKYLILVVYIIVSSVFEVIFFYYYFTDLSFFGTFSGPFVDEWSLSVNLFIAAYISLVLITGLIFAHESLKANDSEIKLKGKILLIAFILFAIGAILDVISALVVINIVARLIMVISSWLFYVGFVLPDWTKKIFLSSEK